MTEEEQGLLGQSDLGPELRLRLATLFHEGWEIWDRFSREDQENDFHPFVPAEYEKVLESVLPYRRKGLKFLEWGSATGVIAIMADLLGFEAYGIELDGQLFDLSLALAHRFESRATFAKGSFIPQGYRWKPAGGDNRLATIGDGPSGYLKLGHHLDEFDVVFAFPWSGEEPMMVDLMKAYGGPEAIFLLNTVNDGVRVYRGGRRVPGTPPGSAPPRPASAQP
jgi:hypothetical protein